MEKNNNSMAAVTICSDFGAQGKQTNKQTKNKRFFEEKSKHF